MGIMVTTMGIMVTTIGNNGNNNGNNGNNNGNNGNNNGNNGNNNGNNGNNNGNNGKAVGEDNKGQQIKSLNTAKKTTVVKESPGRHIKKITAKGKQKKIQRAIENEIESDVYRDVDISIKKVSHEWFGTWGKISQLMLEVVNKENGSIGLKYVVFEVEGYDDIEIIEFNRVKYVESGEIQELMVPLSFSYTGIEQREIEISIRDRKSKIIAKTKAIFDPAEAEQLRRYSFDDVCVGSCLLPSGLNASSYQLLFEVSSGVLNINQIEYVLKNLSYGNFTNETFPFIKLKESERFDSFIDSVYLDGDDLLIEMHHDADEKLLVRIDGSMGDYFLLDNMTLPFDNFTLTIPEYDNEYFRVYFGEKEEIYQFGIQKSVNFSLSIKDSNDKHIEAFIDFIDSDIEKIKHVKGKDQRELKIKEGKYKLKIRLVNKNIKEILFDDADILKNISETLYLEDVPLTEKYVQQYAIDPTKFNFTNALVTVVAKGTLLYKCKKWNFSSQSCYGEWVLFKTGLIPGKEYAFELTPEDPGFAESTSSFFEGWESGNLTTNNWTTSGAGVAWTLTTLNSPFAGTYHATSENANAESILETNVSTSGYININFRFYAKTSALDNGEYIAVDWYNGTGWTNVLPQTQDIVSYTLYDYDLSLDADNNTDFKIRFRCSSNSNNEFCFVDNINVSGMSNSAIPPASVTGLANQSAGTTWIYWNWTNPADADFNQSIIFKDGINVANTSNNFYNMTGLSAGTNYTITIHTKDNNNNINDTDVNSTATAVAEEDITVPTWDSYLANATLEYSIDALLVDFNATDNVAISKYFINDTTRFSINNSGMLQNITLTAIGTYFINVSVNDTNNNVNSTIYQVVVQDTTVPAWSPLPSGQTNEYATAFSYDVDATDSQTITYYVNGSTRFTINSGTGIITNTTVIPTGIYGLQINATDVSGNVNTTTIIVTVQDTTIPTFDLYPANSTLEYAINSLLVDFNASDDIAISRYFINDTTRFIINNSGMLQNITLTAIGTYLINVSVNDTSNNVNSTIYQVVVQDTTPPASISNFALQFSILDVSDHHL